MVLNSFNLLQTILLYAIPLLFAITLHEVAHGWVASLCGDQTARMLGRLTLNPIKHIDPVGTILVPAIMFYFSGFIFGWAKPVPVNWSNLRNQRRSITLVALAGPMANFVMAFGWALIAKIGMLLGGDFLRTAQVLTTMGAIGLQVNLILMVLNLIPIPPLDGGRVLANWLPGKWSYQFQRIEPYGFLVLILLLSTGALGYIIFPFVQILQGLIMMMFGLR